jgi:hypothetical protein
MPQLPVLFENIRYYPPQKVAQPLMKVEENFCLKVAWCITKSIILRWFSRRWLTLSLRKRENNYT